MKQISKNHIIKIKQRTVKSSWWIPVWKGLVVDQGGKHRKRMGLSIWLYLYLLFSVNRKNGVIAKKQKDMAKDLGLTVRAVQKHLARLKKNDYITACKQNKPPKIKLTKWKLFNLKQIDDQ
jgi:hypothetical protein